MVLFLSIINGWSTHQVEFFLAFPQAEIEFEMYMKIPQGIETKGGSRTMHVLNLLKNLYGQRQGSRVWNQHLTKGLQEIGFQQYRVDNCMFY